MRRRLFALSARMLAVVSLAWCLAASVSEPASATPPSSGPPRTIILALDAVPYRTVVTLRAVKPGGDRLLTGMRGPSALISTFPSSTSLAMGGILEPFGLKPSLGYEARFFDRARNELRGGGLISYNRKQLKFGWRTIWDWKAGNVRKITSGLRPIRASISAIDDALEAFLRSDETLFFAYCDATDLVGHLRSPEALAVVLDRLDASLTTVRSRHPDQPFVTVLFSDHGQDGGAPLINVRKPVRRALASAEMVLTKRLRSGDDVVLVPYGLLSSIVAYTTPTGAARAAQAMASVPGVDFCVAPVAGVDDRWWITAGGGDDVDGDGGAEFARRMVNGLAQWRYRSRGGDPLGLATIGEDSPGDEVGAWLDDDWWFERTRGHRYPDPLHRIARGFELVTHPASVLCSLEASHMYGAAVTSASSRMTVGTIHWTHGAMLRNASLGFVMSDHPDWDPAPAVRFDDALKPFLPGFEPSASER